MCRIYFQWNIIFRSKYSFLIYTEKRKEEKKIEFEILATQIRNTNRFKSYIIQQLFNDVNVPRCHTRNLSYENIFITFKNTFFFFHAFIFLGTNMKGTIFPGRVRSHPSHPPQLRACFNACLVKEFGGSDCVHFFFDNFYN